MRLSVSIVNDNELDNEEEFSLTLTTGEDSVNLDPYTTTIRIADDNGEEILINTRSACFKARWPALKSVRLYFMASRIVCNFISLVNCKFF